MSYLLDTNTCIVFLNGRSEPLKDRLLAASPESLLLCAVVKAELFYGALKSGRPAENLARVEQFAERFVSLPSTGTRTTRSRPRDRKSVV